jgi:hypothetical protein
MINWLLAVASVACHSDKPEYEQQYRPRKSMFTLHHFILYLLTLFIILFLIAFPIMFYVGVFFLLTYSAFYFILEEVIRKFP